MPPIEINGAELEIREIGSGQPVVFIHGSMGDDILAAADAGTLRRSECSALMIDYLAPSLDTTISGIASALGTLRFASRPVGYAARRAVPAAQRDQRGAAIRIAVAGVQPKVVAAD